MPCLTGRMFSAYLTVSLFEAIAVVNKYKLPPPNNKTQCNVQQTKTDGDAALMSIDMFFTCLSEYQ